MEWIRVTVEGQSFLLHQIRKMVRRSVLRLRPPGVPFRMHAWDGVVSGRLELVRIEGLVSQCTWVPVGITRNAGEFDPVVSPHPSDGPALEQVEVEYCRLFVGHLW